VSLTYRTVVVEDEPPARLRLRRLLESHPEIVVVGEADSGSAAVSLVETEQPDLVFLDIDLPEFNGFEVLRRLTKPPIVIFTTAHDQYALKAFATSGIDFLLKPVEPSTLARAIAKLVRLTEAGEQSSLQQQLQHLLERWPSTPVADHCLEKLGIRIGERTLLVDLHDVTHFYAKEKFVFLHTAAGKNSIVDMTLAELEQRLQPRKFVRVHRSTIVNIDFLQEVRSWFGGKYWLILSDKAGTRLVMSRNMAANLRAIVQF